MAAVGGGFRRAGWALLGLLASVPLHVIGLSAALFVTLMLGLATPNSPWPQRTQNIFMISFALWQWLYLLPAVLLVGRRKPAMAVGLGASGGLGLLVALLGLLTVLHGM